MAHFHELSDWDSFLKWFFKTKMSFYGMDLNLPWWFGVSSWHYAIYGIVMLLVEPPWAKKSLFPYRAIAFFMIFLQGEFARQRQTMGTSVHVIIPNRTKSSHQDNPNSSTTFHIATSQAPLSFCADYIYMTDESIFHFLDRAMATPAAVLEVTRIGAYLANNVAPSIIAATLVTALTSIYCFCQSAKAQAELDRDGFVVWHYLWHCYPLAASLVVLTENYLRQYQVRPIVPKSVQLKSN